MIPRPDREPQRHLMALTDLGMALEIQRDISRLVYGAWEKELYAESPLFEICERRVK